MHPILSEKAKAHSIKHYEPRRSAQSPSRTDSQSLAQSWKLKTVLFSKSAFIFTLACYIAAANSSSMQ
jgi:hypothetical protein